MRPGKTVRTNEIGPRARCAVQIDNWISHCTPGISNLGKTRRIFGRSVVFFVRFSRTDYIIVHFTAPDVSLV